MHKENVMPGYRHHLAGGALIFFVSLVVVLHWCVPTSLTLIEWGLCALAGSLFPDIDTKSKGQRYFYWLLFLVLCILMVLRRYKAFAFISIMALIPHMVHHRSICHRVWFVIMVPCVTALGVATCMPGCTRILLYDALFFILGALSHIWLDLGWRGILRW
jgi:hypothetical protein